MQWPPLESNPEVFTEYLQKIGLTKDWAIGEVFGFDEELLEFLPQPILGIIVALSGTGKVDNSTIGKEEDVDKVPFYMKQTTELDNACGIIACLHTIYNNDDVKIEDDSILGKYKASCESKTPMEKALILEKSDGFKKEHMAAAQEGQSSNQAPATHHFIAFVVNKDKQLVLLDGCVNGPHIVEDNCEDVLRGSIKEIKRRLEAGEIKDELSMMTLYKQDQWNN